MPVIDHIFKNEPLKRCFKLRCALVRCQWPMDIKIMSFVSLISLSARTVQCAWATLNRICLSTCGAPEKWRRWINNPFFSPDKLLKLIRNARGKKRITTTQKGSFMNEIDLAKVFNVCVWVCVCMCTVRLHWFLHFFLLCILDSLQALHKILEPKSIIPLHFVAESLRLIDCDSSSVAFVIWQLINWRVSAKCMQKSTTCNTLRMKILLHFALEFFYDFNSRWGCHTYFIR